MVSVYLTKFSGVGSTLLLVHPHALTIISAAERNMNLILFILIIDYHLLSTDREVRVGVVEYESEAVLSALEAVL